jgi:hypothetical protein
MSCLHSTGDDCPMCSETLAPSDLSATSQRPGAGRDVEFLRQGTQVGRYVVLSQLGQGGMGVVYAAHDPQLQRIVAIKLLRAQSADGESTGQSRLLREAQAMAQLSHPNVVPVFDCGAFEDGIFIAMEFVRGQSLDTWMAASPRGWREVLHVFLAAGQGLAAAHAADILHRDFKPPNVLMGEDSRPRVSDFGLARSRKQGGVRAESAPRPAIPGPLSLELTQAGSLMGSPSYMSPEQHAGDVTTAATDQYSFCVSLYEGLYGRRPFEATTLAELAALKQRPPVEPPAGTQVPAWVHRAVVRGLAPRPADRFPDMAALLDALEVDPAHARRRRRRRMSAAVAVGTGMAVAVAYWSAARGRTCEGVERPGLAAWSPAVLDRVGGAFRATGLPYAPEALGRVTEVMAAWAQAWGTQRRAACEAANVRGEQTERQLLLRVECLDRQLEEFSALAEALARAGPVAVAQSADAVQRLPVLADCADVRWLEDRRAPPPSLRAEAAEWAGQLARARGLATGGDVETARGQLRAVAEAARARGLRSLEAEAQAALGDLELRVYAFGPAGSAYGAAVRGALSAGDDRLAARVLARLVSLVGWRLHQPQQALLFGDMAEGLLERTGQEAALRALLEEGRGDARWAAGESAVSLAHYREALAWVEASAGPESLDAARLRASVAWLQMEKGEVLAAREGFQRSLGLRERLLGASNPLLADAWCDLSHVEGQLLDLEAAQASARRCAVLRDAAGTNAGGRAGPRLLLADHLQVNGQHADAARVLEELEGLMSQGAGEVPAVRAHLDQLRIQQLTEEGKAAEAVALAREALPRAELLLGKEHVEMTGNLAAVARAQRAAGDTRAALEAFNRFRAVATAGGATLSPSTAATLLERAALLLGGQDEPAALEEARSALAALEAGGPATGARLSARLRWADALWRVPARRAEARRVLEAALPSSKDGERAAAEAWLASHKL